MLSIQQVFGIGYYMLQLHLICSYVWTFYGILPQITSAYSILYKCNEYAYFMQIISVQKLHGICQT